MSQTCLNTCTFLIIFSRDWICWIKIVFIKINYVVHVMYIIFSGNFTHTKQVRYMYTCTCIVELCFSSLHVNVLLARYPHYNTVYPSVVIIFYYVLRATAWEYVQLGELFEASTFLGFFDMKLSISISLYTLEGIFN